MTLRVFYSRYLVEEQEYIYVCIYVHIDSGVQLHTYSKQLTLLLVTQIVHQWLPIMYRDDNMPVM